MEPEAKKMECDLNVNCALINLDCRGYIMSLHGALLYWSDPK